MTFSKAFNVLLVGVLGAFLLMLHAMAGRQSDGHKRKHHRRS
jgi:hypothetical protein